MLAAVANGLQALLASNQKSTGESRLRRHEPIDLAVTYVSKLNGLRFYLQISLEAGVGIQSII
jgi:hypothetical protein